MCGGTGEGFAAADLAVDDATKPTGGSLAPDPNGGPIESQSHPRGPYALIFPSNTSLLQRQLYHLHGVVKESAPLRGSVMGRDLRWTCLM